jgi:hypothetical protein
MRKHLFAFVLVIAAAVPLFSARPAHAIGVEASLGKGVSIDPVEAQPVNVMVAPGVSLLWLRLQLGVAADLPDVKESKFDLGLRPMLSLHPPLLPLYGRLIFAVNNLFHDELRTVAYGGALGLEIAIAGIGLFAEAGFLPRDPKGEVGFTWVVEGRAGISLGF